MSNRVPVPHYRLHPDYDIETIDVIHSKMSASEWRVFCWASAYQYCSRLLDKGEDMKDADKAMTYLRWFKNGRPD